MANLKFIRRPQVESITGLKRSSIYAKMESNEFPKPVKIGQRAAAWIYSEILDWQNERISATRGSVCHEQ